MINGNYIFDNCHFFIICVLSQTTTSDISVNWKSFTDVEEEGNEVHQSGITKYEVAIGKHKLIVINNVIVG